jgi:hypothetical protein
VTYALGEERKTLVRGSFSMYPDALALREISRMNPVDGDLALIVFLDSPGGFADFYDDGEQWAVLGGAFGFNPAAPTALSSSNVNDPNMDPPVASELVLGLEHSFLPEFVTGISFTWRVKTDVEDFQLLFTDADGVDRTAAASEYVENLLPATGTLPDGSSFSIPTFFANPSLSFTGGTFFTNGDRELNYFGTAITFTKRLTNQWMLRGFFNYNFTEEWDVPSSFFNNNDPNRLQPDEAVGGREDGQTFVTQGLSTKADVWMQSDWQWNVNGMYQVAPDRGWGFNVAANVSGRQGYPIPYFVRVGGLDGIGRNILAANDITDFRNDDIFIMDLRLEKEWRATGNTSLTFSIDAFNIFNDGAVLQRFDNLNAGNAAWVRESMSPRVFRLGVRLNWR